MIKWVVLTYILHNLLTLAHKITSMANCEVFWQPSFGQLDELFPFEDDTNSYNISRLKIMKLLKIDKFPNEKG